MQWRNACRIFRSSFQIRQATTIALRPYQEYCLDACLAALKKGASRIGVSLPTGSGKTTVFISLLNRLPAPSKDAVRALIIVNSVELARQSAEQVQRLFPSWTVEIEQGSKYKATGNANVTVATYQTLLRPDRMSKFDPTLMKAIIVDEAHHSAAPSYRRLLAHFDSDVQHPDPDFVAPQAPHKIPIFGFSATFSRHDGLSLGSVFQEIVYHRDFLEMIQEEWLCPMRFTTVKAALNLKNVTISTRTGDFMPTSLAHVINTDTINDLLVKTWLEKAADRKATLVFCVDVAHVQTLTDAFRSYGIDARYVYAKTPITERKTLISQFRAGEFPVLLNCAVLTEGADIPNIDCVMVARPTRSRNIFAQMIGRGMRLSPETGKTDCRVIDFVDSATRVTSIVTTPTLFGLDPGEMEVEDDTPETLEAKINTASGLEESFGDMEEIPEPKSVTFTDYDNPLSFAQGSSSGAPHIASMSPFSWVGCGDDVYILECLGKGFIRIEPVMYEGETCYVGNFTPAALDVKTALEMKVSPYYQPRSIFTNLPNLVDAIRACDTYAKFKVLKDSHSAGILRNAKWRQQPATDNQKAFLRKRLQKLGDTSQDEKIARITKGEAADIISRLRHGAQKRFGDRVKARMKAESKASKEAIYRTRESVKVGPLSSQ